MPLSAWDVLCPHGGQQIPPRDPGPPHPPRVRAQNRARALPMDISVPPRLLPPAPGDNTRGQQPHGRGWGHVPAHWGPQEVAGGSPLLPGSPLPTLSHGLCSAVVVGNRMGLSTRTPPSAPSRSPKPCEVTGLRHLRSLPAAPSLPLRRLRGGSGPRSVPPPAPGPTRRLRPVQKLRRVYCFSSCPCLPRPTGAPPCCGAEGRAGAGGRRELQGGGAQRWQTRGRGCCRHLGTPRHLAGTFLL